MPLGRYKDLLKSFGFQSFLWTQFLGAFNDNVFKIVISMVAVNLAAGSGGGYVSLVGAIFILPFFIFSGYAGYVADIYNKRTVLIITKSFEILAVTFGLFAFISNRIEFMLATLFFMAMHSTFFSPAKYGIVPEMLPDKELSRANGLLEMSTFFAIIIGTSAGTIMYSAWKDRLSLIGLFLIVIAFMGTVMSFGIPKVDKSGAIKNFNFNPWSEITYGIRTLLKNRFLLLTVAGITYFWFLGSLLQMDILLLGKEVMGLSDLRIGILITFLAIGIGAGSITAGRLSGDKVEPGLVPLGSIGMGIFSMVLAVSTDSYPRTAAALMMIGFCGGLFIVPLNALLQQKSAPDEKGRLIATNNFVNTAGILLASAVLWIFRDILNITADKIVFIFGIVTIICTLFVMKALPAFLVRFSLWMLTHTLYKIKIVGHENIPTRGPALLVCNHMSFVDALLVGACVQRFIRFMIYRFFYDLKLINWLLKLMKAIPVSDGNRRDILLSINKAREELRNNHVICIFAEGTISRTGNILPFKKGFERIVEGLDVPVIPVHLDRVWGSIFSFKNGKFFWKIPTHFPYPVTVSFGKPLKSTATAQETRQAITELASEAVEHRRSHTDMLHLKFIKMAKRHWFSFCMADSTGKELSWGKALIGSILLSKGLRKKRRDENMIAVLLPSSVGGAIANIAIQIAGKVPVNLNFTAGADAMRSAVQHCGIKTIITSRVFLQRANIDEMEGMILIEEIVSGISAIEKFITGLIAFILPSRAIEFVYSRDKYDPDKIATIIFTSGSTGTPKGVMLSHHNIISNIEGFAQVFTLSKKDCVLGALPFFHAFGFTATLWFPLLNGLKSVYHANPLDAATIGALARQYKATILIGTPTFYSAYTRKCAREDFESIRYALAGAEKLRSSVAAAFKHKFGKDLLEGYGCTELSPVVSVNTPDIEHGTVKQTGYKPGTVGHPLPGVSVKVISTDTGEELPCNTEGLLLVKAPNLMLGYLGDQERTKQVIKDGWYITGDIASISEDGFITITDRLSRFSKIGGEMVSHGKIEEVLSELFHHFEGSVTGVPDEQKGERLVIFYTNKEITPAEIRDKLLETELPKLWIPKKENIYLVESIPVTGTGKADLRKIKKMAFEKAEAR
ncbi:MAG: MFS transporter [Deltaproteobacteria bacterium]|nr:MFS transporter [Deltaproteobacteria bacterium]